MHAVPKVGNNFCRTCRRDVGVWTGGRQNRDSWSLDRGEAAQGGGKKGWYGTGEMLKIREAGHSGQDGGFTLYRRETGQDGGRIREDRKEKVQRKEYLLVTEQQLQLLPALQRR